MRTRFALAAHLEEWIRSQGEQASPALRDYHINNFSKLISWFQGTSLWKTASTATGVYQFEASNWPPQYFGDEGTCDLPALAEQHNPKEPNVISVADIEPLGNFLESFFSSASYYAITRSSTPC
jgi:hypothetical protein